MKLEQHIQDTITRHAIFQREDLVLVAVSGGADSVALLLILKSLGYHLQALHCNFHLRGEESSRDERFVQHLCEEQGIPLLIRHFDTLAYAQQQGVSIEMAARDLRYQWFDECLQQLHAQAIAVAHHRDDQAETLLLHIIRGAGLRGLAGMRYVNGTLRRPLLDVSKAQLLDYLAVRQQDYVTDSTNLERDALRNKLRLDILPALAQLNPSIHETLATLASNVQDALPIYERGLQSCQPRKSTSAYQASPFTVEEASLTLLHEWTVSCGFNRTQLHNILTAQTGRIITSPTHRLLRDRQRFILHDTSIPSTPPTVHTQTLPVSAIGKMERGRAYLDVSRIDMPVRLRKVQDADRFTPFGMKGERLLSNYLTDLKFNRFQKEEQEVLVDAHDHILWVVGHASSQHHRITSSTTEVLVCQVQDALGQVPSML